MKFKDATITPRYAQQLLARNEGNRKIRANMVSKYAAMMTAGRWMENGDVIRIGKTGRLLDGQHRLHAVIESGIPIRCGLVLDVDETAFSTIDTGGSRSSNDIVRMTGRVNVAATVGTAALLWRMMHRTTTTTAVPPTYAVEILNRWPEIDAAAHRAVGADTARGIVTPTSLSAAYLYLNDIAGKPALADAFVSGMNTGAGLLAGDPILALRQRMINMRQRTPRADTRIVWAGVVRAIDALERGERLNKMPISASPTVDVPALFFDHLSGETDWRKLADLTPYNGSQGVFRANKLAAE